VGAFFYLALFPYPPFCAMLIVQSGCGRPQGAGRPDAAL
jgi:hypothetical protein